MAEPVLCFVDATSKWAWFTTCELGKQPGEKWDAGYRDLNASEPLEWEELRNVPPYELTVVGFRMFDTWQTPRDGYSVNAINRGVIAWLVPWGDEAPPIPAGTTLSEFKRTIREHGGEIYTRED